MTDSKVGAEGSTSDPVATSASYRPGSEYYSYRVNMSIGLADTFVNVVRKYSDNYCIVAHNPDADDHNPHFHCIMLDFDKKKVDAFRKKMTVDFKATGNEFHAGRFRTNDFMEALTYFSHDPVRYWFYPDTWAERIKDAPAWQPNAGGSSHRGPRQRLGDPVLTYSNLVKQALLFRTSHQMDTHSLGNVLSRMVSQGSWLPSRELVSNGVPRELHELFASRIDKRVVVQDWMYPHDRSSKKMEWADQPDKRAKIVHDPAVIQYISK